MADLLVKLQNIEEVVKDVQTLVRQYISSRSHQSIPTQRKRRQPDWATRIDGKISQLAQELQEVKKKIETSSGVTHEYVTAAHHPDCSLNARIATLDRPPDERPQRGGISSSSIEEDQQGDPIIAMTSTKADCESSLVTQLSEPEMDENHVRATTVADQPCSTSTVVPRGVGVSEAGTDPLAGVAILSDSRPPFISAISEPKNAVQSIPEIPRVHSISIPFRMEDDVVVLMPLNMDQCRDAPFLLSQAQALGARETGVFKYVLPDGFESSARIVPSVTTRVSRFTSRQLADGAFQLSRPDNLEKLNIDNANFPSTETRELAEKLEACLVSPEMMNKMRYCTDIPAWRAEDRRQLGLPAESAIWPLKDNLLDRTKRIVDGLHRPYGYLAGEGGSLFAIHREDADLMSFNALYAGRERPWYAVAPQSGHLVENEVKGGKCAQKVRHVSRWIPPSKLKAMGASFVTFVQRVREVVVVWGDTYHQGGAVGPALAEAVNYGGPGWSIEGYSDCSSTCPGYPIANELLGFLGLNEKQREQDKEDSREARNSPLPEGQHHQDSHASSMVSLTDRSLQKRGRDLSPSRRTSRKKRSRTMRVLHGATLTTEDTVWSAPILQMAAAICSRAAIKQFFEIVRGRRDLEPTALRTTPGKDLSRTRDPGQMLQADIRTINMFSRKTAFHDFLTRLCQARLAQHAEDVKVSWEKEIQLRRERIQKGGIQKILKGTGMTKRQFYHHRERGTKWLEYDKMFPGILGFLLFQTQVFDFSSTDWVLLQATDFDCLRRHLKTKDISALCSAGKKFEESLDLTADDVEFVGEGRDASIDKASDQELVAYLTPVPTTDETIYDRDAYLDWPKPDYWPANLEWPADPTSLPPDEKQCEECDENQCECATRRPEIQPRIRIYEGKGRGLQAVAREAGFVAYPKGTRLGWFTGKLAPPNTYRNSRCYAMFREDLPFEPEVAQINCGEISNFFGHMNHDCEPNVELRGKRVSGRYRVAILARRDIRDGEEITVGYGKRFWGNEKCPCPKCRNLNLNLISNSRAG